MPLPEQTVQSSPQVLLVGEKDTKRLLEAYVKRSLSVNDGTQSPRQRPRRTSKWVTLAEKNKRERKHSSDTSLHFKASDEDICKDEAFSEPETERKPEARKESTENKSKVWKRRGTLGRNDGSSTPHKADGKPKKWFLTIEKDKREGKQSNKAFPVDDQSESLPKAKKPKDNKIKKTSVWKSVLGWFSRGNKQEEEEGEGARSEEELPSPEPSSPPASCLPFPAVLSNGDAVVVRPKRTRRRQSLKRLSLKRQSGDLGLDKSTGRPVTLDLSAEAVVKSIEEVESTSFYYEKMTDELQKIVHEVKNSPTEENRSFPDQTTDINDVPISQEEVIERIIALIKQQGDVMDSKLKENPSISSFFNMLSYGSFKKLADQYMQSELPQQKSQPPVAAPELVNFAFTLDFTARVAGLSRHAPGHIVGFGNQYLKDRFTYMSESHPYTTETTTEKTESSDKEKAW